MYRAQCKLWSRNFRVSSPRPTRIISNFYTERLAVINIRTHKDRRVLELSNLSQKLSTDRSRQQEDNMSDSSAEWDVCNSTVSRKDGQHIEMMIEAVPSNGDPL